MPNANNEMEMYKPDADIENHLLTSVPEPYGSHHTGTDHTIFENNKKRKFSSPPGFTGKTALVLH